MGKFLEAVRTFWRDTMRGPKLRTYDAAREELGGMPWRPFNDATERWFLPASPPPLPARALAIDTGALIVRPSLRESLRGKSRYLVAASVAVIVIGAGVVVSSSTSAAPRPAAPVEAVAPAARPVAPAEAAPAPVEPAAPVKPAAPAKMSASVEALFGPSTTTKKASVGKKKAKAKGKAKRRARRR